ncbi:hypothetical protein [Martelella radicis]|uniref:Uncharacterized protein n=1 Tax=Martelella radicis TaxID=1397476 RepID=A0A7W6KN60_9HYPH|nr:hypothetical protein [Martelella radicis]MBB4124321.1 hypothetical protein [Martelella radicis]
MTISSRPAQPDLRHIRHFESTGIASSSGRVSALRIVCGCCEAAGYVPATAALRQGEPAATIAAFGAHGWLVGATPAEDRCPACSRKSSSDRKQTTKGADTMAAGPRKTTANAAKAKVAVARTTAITTSPTPTEAQALQAELPPQMGRDDRRIIMEKLDDVYGDNAYGGSWTDTTVARDLNVPRAWVSEVREAFFGPEGSNPLLDRYTAEKEAFERLHAGFMAARKSHCEAHDQLVKMAMDISKKADEINRLGKRVERELG